MADSPRESSFWTLDELAAARSSNIRRELRSGWKYEDGWLVKGQVKHRPPEVVPTMAGTVLFNPLKDAFAIRLGAVFVAPNRYRLGDLLIDANGACRDPQECPECGSRHGEFRFQVRVENRNPHAKPWEAAWTYCRRCCSPEEVARLRA